MITSNLNKTKQLMIALILGGAFTSTSVLAAESAGLPNQPAVAVVESAPAPATAEQAPASDAININTATAAEIAAAMNGVGAAKAEAIVAFRDLNGPFLQLEEIAQVKGIGAATLEKNKQSIRFE